MTGATGNTGLQFAGIASMLEREYRNTPAYQWARELIRNGIEADAKLIRIGVEWQALKHRGVYRLQYSDDGVGMTRDQLRDYMRTLGKGSKTVGGPHDNYALGCRMTLLPWNPEGVVVISLVDGEPNMVKMMYDPDANGGEGEYVLAEESWIDGDQVGRATVYPPYFNDDEGYNWFDTVPDFVQEAGHGTTFILLGRDLHEDTLNGDRERDEDIRFLSRKYVNTRFWSMPEDVRLQFVEFVNPGSRDTWPKSADDKKAWQHRTAQGAQAVVNYVKREGASTVKDSGVVTLPDGTKAHWWLRHDVKVDTGGIGGSSSGFIAVKYRDELYGQAYANKVDGDTRAGAAVYRQFGIGNDDVRKRVFIVLEPPEYDEATSAPGVAPSTGRADLYWISGTGARSVKASDWADQFAEDMPEAIQKELRAAHASESSSREGRDERLKKVMDRFAGRWKAPKAKVTKPEAESDTTTDPNSPGPNTRQPVDIPSPRPNPKKPKTRVIVRPGGEQTLGAPDQGTVKAKATKVGLGYPDVAWVGPDDINDKGMIAAWQPPSATYANGLIELDETHEVIQGQIRYWQSQYAPVHSEQIRDIVKAAYEDVAIAKVSHMQSLAVDVFSEEKLVEMLQNPALTTSLLGLISEDAVITPRLGGIGAKRKAPPADAAPTAE